MSRSQPVRRPRYSLALVWLIAACMLRSLAPQTAPAQTIADARAASAEHGPAAYPCAGHACCCRTDAQCQSRCCCADEPRPQRALSAIASEIAAARAEPATDGVRVDALEALRCGGGPTLPGATPAGAWVAVLPAAAPASAPPAPQTHWSERAPPLPAADLREPPSPPPRELLQTV